MVLVAPMIFAVLSQTATVTLSGMVANRDGQPVAGAEVFLAGMPVYDPPILAWGRTDAEGRFSIDRPAGLAAETEYITPNLWVVKPGFRLGLARFPGAMPEPNEPVRVVLGPPGNAEVHVEGPDGAPVAGARVRPERFGPQSRQVPEPVEDRIEARTGPDGRAVIEAATNEEVQYVDVITDASGVQGRPFWPATSKPKRVRLRPVSTLEGRIVADDPALRKGWTVSAWTRAGDPSSRDPMTTGWARGTSDEQGRFRFAAIATGAVQLEVEPPRDLPVLPDVPTSGRVVAGKENRIEIPLRKAATVTGIIRELGTGRPVPGVELYFNSLRGGSKTLRGKTDEQGRYTFLSLPGEMRISLFKTPPTHAPGPGVHWEDFKVPEGGRVELKPREVVRAAPPLRFVVRDEQGRLAAHAAITGQSGSRYMHSTTDDQGRFAVPGLPPGGEVSVEVRLGGRMTDGPVKANAGATEPVAVTIVPGLTIAMVGRVVGPGGKPIADAVMKVQSRETGSRQGRPPALLRQIVFGDRREIRTGPDGTFQTPREVYRKGQEFRIEATADGFFPGRSEWYASERGDRLAFPDLVLRPSPTSRRLDGRVIDREGQSIAGASVFQAIGGVQGRATTDAEGRFRLDDVPDGKALVFAEKAGFRFGGAVVGPGDADAQIRLARVEGPPMSISKVPPRARADERAMARELLAPMVPEAQKGSLGFLGHSVLPTLARVDPDRVLAMLENRVLAPTTAILDEIALGQFETDPAAAVATIEADLDPFARATGFLALADATPDADRPRRMDRIDRAMAEARRVENKEASLGLFHQIADRWIDLGEVDRARPVLIEGRRIVASLPRGQFSYPAESFGEVLAVVDLRTAQTLFRREGVTNTTPADASTINRHRAEAAVRLAAIDPAGAEALVPSLEPSFWDAANFILKICRRMSRVDPPRARKILERASRPVDSRFPRSPYLVAEGLGLMALERAAIDPAGARELLDESYDRLREAAAGSNGPGARSGVACLMAAFLPVVERIDSDRLEERLRLAAACRAPIGEHLYPNLLKDRLILAALVSRYDRETADILAAPALARIPQQLTDRPGYQAGNESLFRAVAAYDPRAVTATLHALPPSARKPGNPNDTWNAASLDARIRVAAAQMLALPADDRLSRLLSQDNDFRILGRIR